jgi:hypothetical protein
MASAIFASSARSRMSLSIPFIVRSAPERSLAADETPEEIWPARPGGISQDTSTARSWRADMARIA